MTITMGSIVHYAALARREKNVVFGRFFHLARFPGRDRGPALRLPSHRSTW